MRCENGHDNPGEAKFCAECGARLDVDDTTPAVGDSEASDEVEAGRVPADTDTKSTTPAASVPDAPDPAISGGSTWAGPDVSGPVAGETTGTGSRRRVGWAVAVVAVVAVVVVAAVVIVNRETGPTKIEQAAEECGVERNVGDDGTSITFDTEGDEDSFGDTYFEVGCVLEFLDTPDRVVSQIDQTRALDGTLDASWDEFEAFWNYHPDSGMNMTVYVP